MQRMLGLKAPQGSTVKASYVQRSKPLNGTQQSNLVQTTESFSIRVLRTQQHNSEASTELPDDHSECEPPDPFPNSAVKPLSADGSVGFPHVRVGHRQAS